MEIITATNKEIPIKWGAVSTLDGCLRLCLVGQNFQNAYETFSNPSETSTLTKYGGGMSPKTFEGYTVMKGIEQRGSDIIISLAKGV